MAGNARLRASRVLLGGYHLHDSRGHRSRHAPRGSGHLPPRQGRGRFQPPYAQRVLHDFRRNGNMLSFDVALPGQLREQEAAIRTALENALADIGEETWQLDITFDIEG